jgi:hypothetical protein
MDKHSDNSPKTGKGKGTARTGQIQAVTKFLRIAPATMLMAAHATGIERANICRYLAEMKRTDKARIAHFGLCKITGHRAGYYTCATSSTDTSVQPKPATPQISKE